MQETQQQLYEKGTTPSSFIPLNTIILESTCGVFPTTNETFTCDKTFDEAVSMIKAGANIIIKTKAIFKGNITTTFNYNIHISNVQLYDVEGVIESISGYTYLRMDEGYADGSIGRGTSRIHFNWNINGSKLIDIYEIVKHKELINSKNITTIIDYINTNHTPTEIINNINTIFGSFDAMKKFISKPNSVCYTNSGPKYLKADTDNIIILYANDNNIQHTVLFSDGNFINNTIQIVDQTLFRLSPLTMEPITNPKVWIGNATQYAAIAEKDPNTTYVVKSE